jgi:hypothetical protein
VLGTASGGRGGEGVEDASEWMRGGRRKREEKKKKE